MKEEEKNVPWDLVSVRENLNIAFKEDTEVKLLEILKQNTFLFYELVSRKWSVLPIFHEVQFGNFRCDFLWLSDNSDGPEWVLVEIEKPHLQLFKKNGEPSQYFSHALEQVKSWRRYFDEHPSSKKEIFGAVARFRYILVIGSKEDWAKENNAKWRIDHNKREEIEIKSSDVFVRALDLLVSDSHSFWGFVAHPVTKNSSELKRFWQNYHSLDRWRAIIN